jgi:hypothetical protein
MLLLSINTRTLPCSIAHVASVNQYSSCIYYQTLTLIFFLSLPYQVTKARDIARQLYGEKRVLEKKVTMKLSQFAHTMDADAAAEATRLRARVSELKDELAAAKAAADDSDKAAAAAREESALMAAQTTSEADALQGEVSTLRDELAHYQVTDTDAFVNDNGVENRGGIGVGVGVAGDDLIASFAHVGDANARTLLQR